MTLRVPVAAPGRMDPEESQAVRAALDRAIAAGTFVGGHFVDAFEEQFAAEVLPGSRCVAVGNGQDALTLALQALDLPPGSRVLVPSNDGGFAANSVQALGLQPSQMDCAEDGLVGLDQVLEAWSPQVSAVVVTHLHGLVVDTGAIQRWCHERGIRVLEDCSQAHGAPGIGAGADASIFSFYPTKNLGALGDGGAVVTAEADVATRVRRLRHYGWGAKYRVETQGGRNSRLDSIQAAVLSARLPFLPGNNHLRRAVVSRYERCLPGRSFLTRADDSFVAHHAVLVDEDQRRSCRPLGACQDRLRRPLPVSGVRDARHQALGRKQGTRRRRSARSSAVPPLLPHNARGRGGHRVRGPPGLG